MTAARVAAPVLVSAVLLSGLRRRNHRRIHRRSRLEPAEQATPDERSDEQRPERVWLKRDRCEALRFTAWRNGRFIPRPAYLTEPDLKVLQKSE